MDEKIKKFLRDGARTLKGEVEDIYDAMSYADALARETNSDLSLGYDEDSDEMDELTQEAVVAIREAYKPR